MPLRAAVLALLSLSAAGCGLTLDYDPPTDAGGSMDALPIDGGCGVCSTGTTCIAGACRHPCASPADCHFDDANCETCDVALGACVVAEVTCSDECGATCDPTTDRCAPNCPDGQRCVGGICTSPRTCTDATDCMDLTAGPCGRAACVGGLCEDVLPAACVEIDYDCAEIDRCADCAVVPRPERCAPEELCTGAPDHRCVECTNADLSRCAPGEVCDPLAGCVPCPSDAHCVAAGQPPFCVSGRCVACRDGGDCVRAGLGAACVEGACVGCLADGDCTSDGLPVCDAATNTCVACRRAGDCPLGQRCYDGDCRGCVSDDECPPFLHCEAASGRCSVRTCGDDRDCPATPCGGAGRCLLGRCAYPAAPISDFCDDGVDCTVDSCAPDSPDADANGCRFEPVHLACVDDLVACTVQACAGDVPGADSDGCVTRYLDRLCALADTACAVGVCVGRSGVSGDVTGCRLRLDPALCVPGVCALDGECDPPPGCAGCVDDGWDCNGVETCRGGTCQQIFDGTGGCFGRCGEFCRDDGSCGFRPSFGGALCAGP